MSKDKEVLESSKTDHEGGSAPVASKKTSVDLTAAAGVIKEKYQPIYGLRNILSAGLMLFALASPDLRVGVIRAAHGEPLPDELRGTGSDKKSPRGFGDTLKRYAVEKVLCAMFEDLTGPSRRISLDTQRAVGELAGLVGQENVEKALAKIKERNSAAVAV